jgi:hypothetical protein
MLHTRTCRPRARKTGATIRWSRTTARTLSGNGSPASTRRRASFAASSRATSGPQVPISLIIAQVGGGERDSYHSTGTG